MRSLIRSDIHLRRWPMRYIGFDGTGKQARDTFHPADLAALLERQIRTERREGPGVYVAGTQIAMSLAQQTPWYDGRFAPHAPESDPRDRPNDIP